MAGFYWPYFGPTAINEACCWPVSSWRVIIFKEWSVQETNQECYQQPHLSLQVQGEHWHLDEGLLVVLAAEQKWPRLYPMGHSNWKRKEEQVVYWRTGVLCHKAPCIWFQPVLLFKKMSKLLLSLGEHVCKEAWMYMLAVGRKRLSRCKRNFSGQDGRSLPSFLVAAFRILALTCPATHLIDLLTSGTMARSSEKSMSVRGFFVHLYWTAGEPMTKERHVCNTIALQFFWLRVFCSKRIIPRMCVPKDCIQTIAWTCWWPSTGWDSSTTYRCKTPRPFYASFLQSFPGYITTSGVTTRFMVRTLSPVQGIRQIKRNWWWESWNGKSFNILCWS